MALDFRATQVRTYKVIASGSTNGRAQLLFYNFTGDTAPLGQGTVGFVTSSVGTDVFAFFSGSIGQRKVGASNGTTLFGGDLITSGGFTALFSSSFDARANFADGVVVGFGGSGSLGGLTSSLDTYSALGILYQSTITARNKADTGWMSVLAYADDGSVTNALFLGDLIGYAIRGNALTKRVNLVVSSSTTPVIVARFDAMSGSQLSSSLQLASGGLYLGPTTADPGTGNIALPNSGTIWGRNFANNGNIRLALANSNDTAQFGDFSFRTQVSGTTIHAVGSTYFAFQTPIAYWYDLAGTTQKMILQSGLTLGPSSTDPGAGNIALPNSGSIGSLGNLIISGAVILFKSGALERARINTGLSVGTTSDGGAGTIQLHNSGAIKALKADNSTQVNLISMSGSTNLPVVGYTGAAVAFPNGVISQITTVTASYTTLPGDYIILVTNTSAPRTITLSASYGAGVSYIIKDMSGGAGTIPITITPSGSGVTIDGLGSLPLGTNYGSLAVFYDGTNWGSL